MWPTVDGLRMLTGGEAVLVRKAVGGMVTTIVLEWQHRDECTAEDRERWIHGVDWFDQWEPEQRIWLLEQVTSALLSELDSLPPAAMFEATVDAIFCTVVEEVDAEIESNEGQKSDWREAVVSAYQCLFRRDSPAGSKSEDMTHWRRMVTQISDAILGVAAYQKAEQFRDVSITRLQRFLNQKGLPEDFLLRIPPMRSPIESAQSLDRLRRLL